jgi:hypothetical protein
MNILNRKELFLTRDPVELNRAIGHLTTNGIAYKTTTNSVTNPGRSHGVPGIRADYAYQYRIYVHKKDYERAKRAIGKR